MGLDLEALGKPKNGLEAEWQTIVDKMYMGSKNASAEDNARFGQITIPTYSTISAPIIGQDPEANEWWIAGKPDGLKLSDEDLINQAKGIHILELLYGKCDGVPKYSNGSATNGIGRHTFRGEFLKDCKDLMGENLLNQAWRHVISPEEAVTYGNTLLQMAQQPHKDLQPKNSFFQKLLNRKSRSNPEVKPDPEHISILESAGKWYVFWGGRGHPIWANY